MNKFKDINLGLDMPDTKPEVQKSKSEKHRVITKDKITIQIHEKNDIINTEVPVPVRRDGIAGMDINDLKSENDFELK